MKEYQEAMERLHDIEPPAFNPDYDEVGARYMKYLSKEISKAAEWMEALMGKDAPIELLDEAEDRLRIYNYAANNKYGYSISEAGIIQHDMEKGMGTIKKLGLDKSGMVHQMKRASELLGIMSSDEFREKHAMPDTKKCCDKSISNGVSADLIIRSADIVKESVSSHYSKNR